MHTPGYKSTKATSIFRQSGVKTTLSQEMHHITKGFIVAILAVGSFCSPTSTIPSSAPTATYNYTEEERPVPTAEAIAIIPFQNNMSAIFYFQGSVNHTITEVYFNPNGVKLGSGGCITFMLGVSTLSSGSHHVCSWLGPDTCLNKYSDPCSNSAILDSTPSCNNGGGEEGTY